MSVSSASEHSDSCRWSWLWRKRGREMINNCCNLRSHTHTHTKRNEKQKKKVIVRSLFFSKTWPAEYSSSSPLMSLWDCCWRTFIFLAEVSFWPVTDNKFTITRLKVSKTNLSNVAFTSFIMCQICENLKSVEWDFRFFSVEKKQNSIWMKWPSSRQGHFCFFGFVSLHVAYWVWK